MQDTIEKNMDVINKYLHDNKYDVKYGSNSLLLYSLTLQFGEMDVDAASEYLTDGSDDKKIDLVYVNKDEQTAIIAQSYYSNSPEHKIAKANKASDLNAGISWLLSRSLTDLPDNIQAAAQQLRMAIKRKEINNIEIWYVHNLAESSQVRTELVSVLTTTKSILKDEFPDNYMNIKVSVKEVGCETLSRWYRNVHNTITVNKRFKIKVPGGFQSVGTNSKWKTFMTSIPLKFLYDLYTDNKDTLFSGNVREYLGSRRGSSNINTGIKDTVSKSPEDFLIYNNGITLLTSNYKYDSDNNILELNGISIINGAQTTGAIGSVDNVPSDGSVFTRIVQIDDNSVLNNVIEYNNKQNAMNPADFRSNDQVQKRLRKDFKDTNLADYSGGRRGGNGDAIKRNSKLLNNNTIAQVLTSFMGNPTSAYQSVKRIWESNNSYSLIFNDSTNEENILFCYTLYLTFQTIKQDLLSREKDTIDKEENSRSFSDADQKSLELLRTRGAMWIMIAAIAKILPDILIDKVSDEQFIHFKKLESLDDAVSLWTPLANMILPITIIPFSPVLTSGLKNKKTTDEAIQSFAYNFKSILAITPKDSLTSLVSNISTQSPKSLNTIKSN